MRTDSYSDQGNNTRDNWVAALIMLVLIVAGASVAAYFDAPWWIYAGVGFFAVIVLIASIDQIRSSGCWAISLSSSEGGWIESPEGRIVFSEDDLIGIVMARGGRSPSGATRGGGGDSGAGAGYYLVLRQGPIYLNQSALRIFPLVRYIKSTRREKADLPGEYIHDLLDEFPNGVQWGPHRNKDD